MTYPVQGIDYYVYYQIMPPGIYACVATNPDGTYTIWLDPRRTPEQLRGDLDHELRHIIRDDFYNDLPIQIIEAS